jgi:hypothetical protein
MQITPQTDCHVRAILHLSQVERCEELPQAFNVQLISGIRSNMENVVMPVMDKIMLRRRGIVEASFNQLKNISQIQYFPYRSPKNGLRLFASPNSRQSGGKQEYQRRIICSPIDSDLYPTTKSASK